MDSVISLIVLNNEPINSLLVAIGPIDQICRKIHNDQLYEDPILF